MSRYRQTMTEALKQVREANQKPYVSMSSGGQYNVLDKDGKTAYSTRDKTLAYDYFKKNYDNLKEATYGWTLVSKAKDIAKKFKDNMTKAVAEIEKLEKGLSKNPTVDAELRKYNENLEEKYTVVITKKDGTTMELGKYNTSAEAQRYVDQYGTGAKIKKEESDLDEDNFDPITEACWVGYKQVGMKDKGGKQVPNCVKEEEVQEEVSLQEVSDNLKLAVLKRKIKQYKDKVFKKTMSTIKSPLFADYEEMEEGRLKDIFTAGQEGKSAEEIAKLMKLSLKTVKNILGEEVVEEQILEFTSDMIKRLQKSYSTMPKKITPEQATALSKHLDRLDLASLKQLTKAEIPFVTALARNKIYKKTGKFEEVEVKEETDPSVALATKEKEIETLKNQLSLMKQKIENEKNKAIKPMPNPETGEVPLTVGIAHKILNDRAKKEKEEKEQEENSKKIRDIARGKEGEKLESFTRRFLKDLNESEASDKAKGLGLDYMSFGRYGKDGKVTHKSSGGNLTALSKKDQEKEKDTDKPIKPKTKTTGSIKNPDDSNTTSGSVKKEILSKINDEDLTNPKALSDNDEQLTNLADDLRQTGDEETADKIIDALRSVEDGSDIDAPAKIDDMMNALKGRPDLNSQYQNELGKMTNLYTDAKYSGKNVNNFVKDTSNIINKISQLADVGSMDSDDYGTAIRSDAFAEIASTCDALQEKLPNIDGIDKDMKDQIGYELGTIMSMDAENAVEVDVVQVISKLKYYFKKLSKNKLKEEKKEVKEEVELEEATGVGIIKKHSQWKKQPGGGMYPRYKHTKHGEINIDRYGEWKHIVNGKVVAFFSPSYPDNKFSKTGATSMDFSDYFKLKKLDESTSKAERDKRIQKAKDMIKYYDAQKKAALKGKNKDLAKKMLKNDIEETVSIKAYKNAVDPSKKGLMISKSGGTSGTIMIKDKKELKDLETKLAQAKRMYSIKEEKRMYIESMAGLKTKAEKSGMPYSILKKVYDRGMAAWKSGHRPGASQQQWAYARVNSFITKSSGTWGSADKDLAKQVKG